MIIGKNIETGENVKIDLDKFIDSRAVLTASSGQGKSWLVRKILQESFGKAQQIILDWEGEYSNLREEFDYLLVGNEGEIPIHIRTAEILAKKLMELKVSTIIDLSDLARHERITFVKRFLDSLLNLPKELYDHLVMLFIDEANQLAPQKGNAESLNSVDDAMSTGRKRGIGTILCTQRIAKLNKDAVAEARNGAYGGMGLLEDRKRACDELGFNTSKLEQSIKYLEPGEFYMFGSAISKEVIKVKIGEIRVKPPKVGKKGIGVISKTPEAIKKIIKDLADLPKEAEEELRNTEDMKKKIRELKYQLTIAEKSKSVKIDEKAIERAKEQAVRETENHYEKELKKLNLEHNQYVKKIEQSILPILKRFSDINKLSHIPEDFYKRTTEEIKSVEPFKLTPLTPVCKLPVRSVIETKEYFNPDTEEGFKLNLCERKLYNFLYQYPDRDFSKSQIGVFTGYSHKSGGFNNALSHLNSLNLIKRVGTNIKVDKLVSSIKQEFDFSKEEIISKLGKCEKEIYNFLLENPTEEFSKEALGEATNYSSNSGGFNNSISRLSTLGLIIRNGGLIQLNPELLEL